MDSAESPGSPKGLTEVTDDWKNRSEINDSGNLQRGSGLKINDEVQGKELGSGNENENQTRKGESYEEIISVEEEIVIEETEEELSKEENKEEEVEAKNDIMEDIKGRETSVEGNKSGIGQSVAGIEHWPDLTANSVRPSLPRRSKMMHKIVPDKNLQGGNPYQDLAFSVRSRPKAFQPVLRPNVVLDRTSQISEYS
ncbi:hypothetical protein YC2023_060354 [Brassica napus]